MQRRVLAQSDSGGRGTPGSDSWEGAGKTLYAPAPPPAPAAATAPSCFKARLYLAVHLPRPLATASLPRRTLPGGARYPAAPLLPCSLPRTCPAPPGSCISAAQPESARGREHLASRQVKLLPAAGAMGEAGYLPECLFPRTAESAEAWTPYARPPAASGLRGWVGADRDPREGGAPKRAAPETPSRGTAWRRRP